MCHNPIDFLACFSELHTAFTVECQEPFTVEPSEAVLTPHGTTTLTAKFKPTHAAVYEAMCVVKYGTDLAFAKSTKFEGIGELLSIAS